MAGNSKKNNERVLVAEAEATEGEEEQNVSPVVVAITRQKRWGNNIRYMIFMISSTVLLLLLLLLAMTGIAIVRGGGGIASRSQRGGGGGGGDTIQRPLSNPVTRVQKQRHLTTQLFTPQQQQQQQQQTNRRSHTRSGTFTVIERYPHDPNAFTQGLQMMNATHYYESLGIYGQSSIRIVKLSTGVAVLETKMSNEYFGEGMTLYNPGSSQQQRLIQITWQEQDAFIYNSKTLKELGRISFETSNGEGWGITYDTTQNVLYVTDGSSNLHTWPVPSDNERTIKTINQIQVYKKRRNKPKIPITNLNELEYDVTTNTVLANIWQQDIIVRINPRTGLVKKIYNMSSLYPNRSSTADVLNGIAKIPNSNGNEFLITGKKWPYIYRVRFD